MSPKRGSGSRSRSIEDFDRLFQPYALGTLVDEARRARRRPLRVLEIGCGEGRLLMEMLKRWPELELHGINRKPWPAMTGSASLRSTARFYGIFTPRELDGLALPAVHFLDAEALPFPRGHFDLVISQISVRYIARKERTLEEVWRVLRPGGRAWLHLDFRHPEAPDFMAHDTPSFLIYDGATVVPLERILSRLRRQGCDLRLHDNQGASMLLMHRHGTGTITLPLAFDELSSFDLALLNENWTRRPDVFWGYRSVYRLVKG